MLLCDTGVLLAAGNVKDHHHAACLAHVSAFRLLPETL
jgi:predicted nucleic acid-binding protein